jgi:hypothetical protein
VAYTSEFSHRLCERPACKQMERPGLRRVHQVKLSRRPRIARTRIRNRARRRFGSRSTRRGRCSPSRACGRAGIACAVRRVRRSRASISCSASGRRKPTPPIAHIHPKAMPVGNSLRPLVAGCALDRLFRHEMQRAKIIAPTTRRTGGMQGPPRIPVRLVRAVELIAHLARSPVACPKAS